MYILVLKGMNVIEDDGLWDTISTNDIIKDELRYLFSSNICHGNSFNPFCEIFGRCDNELMDIG